MRYPVKKTDAGRKASGHSLERRDCTVRTLALVGELSYTKAHDIMFEAGRKYSKGADPIP